MEPNSNFDVNHAKQVTSAPVSLQKPKLWRQLAKIFIPADPVTTASNLMKTVIEPSIRKTAVDIFATYMLGHPVTGSSIGTTVVSGLTSAIGGVGVNNNTPYSLFSQPIQTTSTQMVAMQGPKFNGIIFFPNDNNDASFGYTQASMVLEELNRILREYKMVKLSELYEAAGIAGSEYVNNRWGWVDLSGAQIYPTNGGYNLQLPPVRVLS